MRPQTTALRAAKWLAGGVGVAGGAYAAYAATTWLRYGSPRKPTAHADALLDFYLPQYDVADRHHRYVKAPADTAFTVASDANLTDSPLVGALFKAREAIFGRPSTRVDLPRGGLREQATSIGWGVLAEVPRREMVFGAVTQPWKKDVVFRALPPNAFAAFAEPGYVKIVWTIRIRPVGASACIASTETRVATTDADARARFRWYWSFLSPGIKIIRLVMLGQIKNAAEQRTAEAHAVAV